MENSGINAFGLFFKGGPMMWPIGLCSILALTIFIEKFSYFRSVMNAQFTLRTKVFTLIKQDQLREAAELCEASPLPMASILKTGLMKSGSDRAHMKESILAAGDLEIPRIEHHINILLVIGQLTMLIGLLGTALGLCNAFYSIEQHARALNPITIADFSNGLWQALLSTVAGLTVAIPTLLAYHFLQSRSQELIHFLERTGSELMSLLEAVSSPAPIESATPPSEEM